VVAAVHDGDAACAVAEVPPTAATVSPATRAAAAAMTATIRSGRLLPGGRAGLILFHVIVNAPQTAGLNPLLAQGAASPGSRPAIASAAWPPLTQRQLIPASRAQALGLAASVSRLVYRRSRRREIGPASFGWRAGWGTQRIFVLGDRLVNGHGRRTARLSALLSAAITGIEFPPWTKLIS
jgi:hypothetical protein